MVKNTTTIVKASPPQISSCLLYIIAYWIALLILGRLASRPEAITFIFSWPGQAAAVVAAAILGLALWNLRRPLYRTLASLPFAVSMMISIVAATAAGTFIMQGSSQDLAASYGSVLTRLLVGFGLNDLFHALWFNGFLLLLAVSLLLVVVKKKMWKTRKWGYLLAHLGVVVVLVGGLTGNVFGLKGYMDLTKGKTVDSARNTNKPGASFSLQGFAIRLEDFSIEHYNPEYRLNLYAEKGGSYQAVKWVSLKDAADWQKAGAAEFRVAKTYPDFHLSSDLEPAREGEGRPAVALGFPGADAGHEVSLFAGDPERSGMELPPPGPMVEFVWEAPGEAELAARSEARPETHVVSVQETPDGPAEDVSVEPGGSYEVLSGKYRLKALAYLPDFVYDTDTHSPGTRSENPNNPALKVTLMKAGASEGRTSWLFAKMPDFSMQHGKDQAGPRLVYTLKPASEPVAREVMIVGQTRELIELDHGKVAKRETLGPESSGIPEIGASSYKLYESARESERYENKSKEWNNPVVEVELRQGSTLESVLLPASHSQPLRLPPDGKTILALEPKSDEVKAYRSTLTVLEGGNKVMEKTVAVNDPLHYKGFSFYQSSFRKEDPNYSGIQVVKDPGLPLIWAGFVMVSGGVIFAFYIRPRIAKKGASDVE